MHFAAASGFLHAFPFRQVFSHQFNFNVPTKRGFTALHLAAVAGSAPAARMLAAHGAKLDARAPDATQYCAMAKRFVTDTGSRVADEALQLLGGYGYLADYGVEKIVRDLRVHRILEGTNEIMRVIIARGLLKA